MDLPTLKCQRPACNFRLQLLCNVSSTACFTRKTQKIIWRAARPHPRFLSSPSHNAFPYNYIVSTYVAGSTTSSFLRTLTESEFARLFDNVSSRILRGVAGVCFAPGLSNSKIQSEDQVSLPASGSAALGFVTAHFRNANRRSPLRERPR